MNNIEKQLFDLVWSSQLTKEILQENIIQNMLELFLVHINANKTLNDFVKHLIDQGIEHVNKKIAENKRTEWFTDSKKTQEIVRTFRKSFFRKLSNETILLYHLLRDSSTLLEREFVDKYYYLPDLQSKYKVLQLVAKSVVKEDYFWIQCLRIAYQNESQVGYSIKQIIEGITQYAAAYDSDSIPDNHALIKSIEDSVVRSKISQNTKRIIEMMLKEYFARDNPFTRSVIMLPAAKPTSVDTKNLRKQQCTAEIKTLLGGRMQTPAVKPTIDRAQTSSSSAKQSYKSILTSKVAIAEFFKKHNISKTQAMDFLRSKIVRFDSMQDSICSERGYRVYEVNKLNTDENIFLAAGVLTCILHGIRLLFVTNTVPRTSSGKYQKLLSHMVTEMSEWTIGEVLDKLNLNSLLPANEHPFASFVERFIRIETQLFTNFTTTSWSTISDSCTLANVIQEMYANYSSHKVKEDRSSVFFLAFTDQPKSEVKIQYVFQHSTKYKTNEDGNKVIDVDGDDPNNNYCDVLQVAGMVFQRANTANSGERYFFQFITYSRVREDGQYHIFTLNSYGAIIECQKVPYAYFDPRQNKMILPTPKHLYATSEEGAAVLIGLILVRNDQQSINSNPNYLDSPIIRRIQNRWNTFFTDIHCNDIKILKSESLWLNDEIIHGVLIMMEEHLLSKYNYEDNQIVFSSFLYERHIKNAAKESNSFNSKFLKGGFVIFVINLSGTHWICACVARNMKCIYILDSLNTEPTHVSDDIKSYLRKYLKLKDNFETVYLKSPDQEDGRSCGLFTIVNASIFLQSIVTGKFPAKGPEWRWYTQTIPTESKQEMRQQVLDIFLDRCKVDVLLKWIKD